MQQSTLSAELMMISWGQKAWLANVLSIVHSFTHVCSSFTSMLVGIIFQLRYVVINP